MKVAEMACEIPPPRIPRNGGEGKESWATRAEGLFWAWPVDLRVVRTNKTYSIIIAVKPRQHSDYPHKLKSI